MIGRPEKVLRGKREEVAIGQGQKRVEFKACGLDGRSEQTICLVIDMNSTRNGGSEMTGRKRRDDAAALHFRASVFLIMRVCRNLAKCTIRLWQ